MSLDILGPTARVIAVGLDGVSMRQKVIADNIANVDTPHFRASAVEFESSLRAAMDDGRFESRDLPELGFSAATTVTPVGPNGNNVDLRHEVLAAMQTSFQGSTLTRAITDQAARMRVSMGLMS